MQLTLTLLALLSTVYAAPQPANMAKLKRATTRQVKENSYIVKLKDDASLPAVIDSLNDLASGLNAPASLTEIIYSDWTGEIIHIDDGI